MEQLSYSMNANRYTQTQRRLLYLKSIHSVVFDYFCLRFRCSLIIAGFMVQKRSMCTAVSSLDNKFIPKRSVRIVTAINNKVDQWVYTVKISLRNKQFRYFNSLF
jgi:hypothetical protein